MKDRTLQILQALIKDFVDSASPVASAKLLRSHQIGLSSATIRNEFSRLEEVGLIESPHISSGKIPTEKGYRFFVDELLEEGGEEMGIAVEIFQQHAQKYRIEKSKESVFDVLRILAEISGNVAFSVLNTDRTLYIGLSNVLRTPEFAADPRRSAEIFEIFEGRDRFSALINSLEVGDEIPQIFIGEENLLPEIASCAMVLTGISSANLSGKIGILGPMRMKYAFNRSLLQQAKTMIL